MMQKKSAQRRSTLDKNARSPYRLLWYTLSYCAIAAVLVSLLPVASSTEAREIHVAQLMAQGESLLLPLRNGVVPSKPPLFHWLTYALGQIEGAVTPGTARRISVFSAFVVLGVFSVGLCGFAGSSRGRRMQGALGALLIATTPMFVRLLLDARVDMLFAASCFLAWCAARNMRMLHPTLFWSALSAAILAKGPLGIVLVCLLCGTRALLQRQIMTFLRFLVRPNLAQLFLLVPLAWYCAATVIGGKEFIWRVGFENVARFFEADPQRSLSAAIYLDAIFIKLAPLSLLALVFLCFDLWRGLQRRRWSARVYDICSVLVAGVFFALSQGKRDAYLLPLAPLLAQYVAASLYCYTRVSLTSPVWIGRLTLYSLHRVLSTLGLITLAVFFLLSLFSSDYSALGRFAGDYPLQLVCMLLAVICWTQLALRYFSLNVDRSGVGALCALFAGFLLYFYAFGLGTKSSLKEFEAIARDIRSIVADDEVLTVVKEPLEEYFDPLEMYLGRGVAIAHFDQKPLFDEKPLCDSWYITRQPYLPHFPPLQFQVLRRYTIASDTLRDKTGREILLLRCRPSQPITGEGSNLSK